MALLPNLSMNGFALKALSDANTKTLSTELDELRRELKSKHNVRNFHGVWSDLIMAKLARFAPITCDDLSHFDGFNSVKIKKYGQAIVGKIREFLSCNHLQSPCDAVPAEMRMS